jgi:sugar O-acyltransferase (sialic acid O-acetyltransferase NeuD family)
MVDKHLNIIGTGGHAKVVIEIANILSKNIDGLFDDDKKKHHFQFCNIEIKGNIDTITNSNAIIAIGDNFTRKKIYQKLIDINWKTLIHPSAIIASNVNIKDGSLIVAGAIIQTGSNIGSHCIINTNSSVDHDCIIDDFVHISPSATLCGNVKVGEGSHIGAGATIIPNINIGKWCVIGAGAVITKDVPDYSLVVGIPGKIIKKLKND